MSHVVKHCKDCNNCYDLTKEKLRQYIFAIDETITKNSKPKAQRLNWSFGELNLSQDDHLKLSFFKSYLVDYLKSLNLQYKVPMCPSEVQSVIEAVDKYIPHRFHYREDYSTVDIVEMDQQSWIINNPECFSYEEWETSLIQICPKIGIVVTEIDQTCSLVKHILSNRVNQRCSILSSLSAISVDNKNCNVSTVKVNLAECKNDYEILVKETKCDLSFETYVSLINCNISSNTIAELIRCGSDISFDVELKCPVMNTQYGKIDLSKIDVNIFNADQCLLKSVIGASISECE